jgi:hypothetical protein
MNPLARTAITRRGLSGPARWLLEADLLRGRILDYGCGRGGDADRLRCSRWDPHWSPRMPRGTFDTVLCTYVLNVLPKSEEASVLAAVQALLLRPMGTAFVSVRRDVPREGIFRDGYEQRWVELDLPVIRETGCSFCIYALRPWTILQDSSSEESGR